MVVQVRLARPPKSVRGRDDDRAHCRDRGKCRGRGHGRSVGDAHTRDRGGIHCMDRFHRSLQCPGNWSRQSDNQHLDMD